MSAHPLNSAEATPTEAESEIVERKTDDLLVQIRSDRRLGHEWDDWDGEPLPDDGVFEGRKRLFFIAAFVYLLLLGSAAGLTLWLVAPRLSSLAPWLPGFLAVAMVVATVLAVAWLLTLALAVSTGRNLLPRRLAEGGVLPWVMPRLERAAGWVGLSRDVIGNAMLRVFDRVSLARAQPELSPEDLLILLPRCLARDAMRDAMSVSSRYDVPIFVASRGRYARQMISMRRPKAVIAIACERDLVSGLGDVAGRLPVLGSVLSLPEGPCKGTELRTDLLEGHVRYLLGLPETQPR